MPPPPLGAPRLLSRCQTADDLHVTLDRSPILGSPFRCYLSSAFVRPPLSLRASLVEYREEHAKGPDGKRLAKSREVAVPAPSSKPSACMVDGQLVMLSTALSTPKSTNRWPSAHTCQFKPQFMNELVYISQPAPPCRWRSCLLPSHDLDSKHTLVGGPSSVYIITQSHGAAAPIDGISCAEVIGGGAWRPPQSFISLRPNGRTPDATDGFVALYTGAVQNVRQRALSLPDEQAPAVGEEEDENAPPPPPKKKGAPVDEGDGEEGDAPPPPLALPPCLWLIGGTRSDGLLATMDCYDLEEERWTGDPLEFEPGSLAPPAMSHTAACAIPRKDGKSQVLWVFGGRTAAGLSGELWTFDVQTLSWALVAGDGMPPEPREQHSLTRVLTRFLFAFGGLNSDASPMLDVALFDLETHSWSVMQPSPSLPRMGHVAGYASGSLYIFGGTDGERTSSELFKFDCDELFPQTAALCFDGQTLSNVMTVKASPSLNALLDKFTVECWVYPASFPPQAPAVAKADGSYRAGFGLISLDEASARKYVAIDKDKVKEGGPKEKNPWEGALADAERLPTMAFFVNGLKKETTCLLRVNPDEWSHVAGTFDGKTLITYVNGRRADYCTLDPVPQPDEYLQTQGDLQVGGIKDKSAWDGLVDAVRLWNVCLSWEEIRANMNDTLLGPEFPTMIGQWSCNEGAGEDCVDSSARANHGVLEGDSAKRVMCTRDRVEPTKTQSELHIDQNFERLRKWRLEFEKRVGREVTQADLLLADESIRKTARRLGLLP